MRGLAHTLLHLLDDPFCLLPLSASFFLFRHPRQRVLLARREGLVAWLVGRTATTTFAFAGHHRDVSGPTSGR